MIYTLIAQHSVGLPKRVLCEITEVSRSGFYRFLSSVKEKAASIEVNLIEHIEHICVDMPGYGYRRVTRALQRMGYRINHKRVLRLMRSNDLLCKRKKGSVRTTNSRHTLGIYPNLAKDIQPTSPDLLWVADITYIRLPKAFVYLAVIMDLFTRRIVGWSLGRDIDTRLIISALRMALRSRSIKPGLIHHSDRGVQYASSKYINMLKQHGIIVSMSRKGNPYDNAIIESFIKTLKYEEVLLNEYESFEEAYDYIAYYINEVYNKRRLHSALGYNSPVEFEIAFEERRLEMVLKQEENVPV